MLSKWSKEPKLYLGCPSGLRWFESTHIPLMNNCIVFISKSGREEASRSATGPLPGQKPSRSDELVQMVDLDDIIDFVKSLSYETWVPSVYWSNKNKHWSTPFYDICWAIYSYLVSRGLLVIEDKYFGRNSERKKVYLDRSSYYNPLEESIYRPIQNRMILSGHLDIVFHRSEQYYVIGKRFIRRKNELIGNLRLHL